MARRAMEKAQAAIQRILEEKQFQSLEEANLYLREVVAGGKVPEVPSRTLLEEAQDLVYSAWEKPSRKKRLALGRRALEVSRDCVDAYVLLAEETADSLEEQRNLYEEGVRAGERALGAKAFRDDLGHFWGILRTRPYMRARAGLADCLWQLGKRGEAISHYQDMLRLNQNDNQGLRYLLLNHLLEDGRDREAKDLLDQYAGDHSAWWLFSKALLKFKKEGSNSKTDGRLRKALAYNPYVPAYLMGLRKLPKHLPAMVGLGDENEAIEYVAGAFLVWRQTPDALKWLAAVMDSMAARSSS